MEFILYEFILFLPILAINDTPSSCVVYPSAVVDIIALETPTCILKLFIMCTTSGYSFVNKVYTILNMY